MTCLVFYKNDNPIFRYPVLKERLSIGRDPTSDVVLADENVSRLHCEVFKRGGKLIIKDSSVNGTFLNNQRITQKICGKKDEVKVGDWVIKLERDAPTYPNQTTVSGHKKATKIISFDQENKILHAEIVEMKIKSPNGDKAFRKSKVSKIVMGTSENSDVVVDDDYVSKKHCKLYIEDGRLYLADLGSTNGTFYEEEKIDKIALPNRARFTIGKSEVLIHRTSEREKILPTKGMRLGQMIGASDSMKEIFALIRRVAPTDATSFITGESGTGKELVARSIHEESNRDKGPFVAINCGAMPPNMIESELFGHEKGAFTGASQTHRGVFEQSHTGTLFLDEIGEMPIDLQTRLLRVLETKTIRRIGGQRDINVDVRIVAATNQDAKQNVLNGKFREDLFFRLYIIPIHMPPLRERKIDIELLAHYFANMFSAGDKMTLTQKAVELLTNHSWAGNVRELRNTIQRAVIMNNGGSITPFDISLTELRDADDVSSLPLISQEKEAIIDSLRRFGGNQSKAAHHLGIARTTLANKIKKYEIEISLMRI